MKFIKSLVGLVIVTFAVASHADAIITNAAELAGLSTNDISKGRYFELTGTILTPYPHLFVSEGKTILLRGDIHESHVQPGDIVFVRGITQPKRTYYVLTTEKRAKTTLPKPRLINPRELGDPTSSLELVTLHGRATTVFQDEIDPEYVYLVLDCSGTTVFAATSTKNVPLDRISSLEGAEIEAVGALMHTTQAIDSRMYLGDLFKIWDEYPIRILKPAPTDLDQIPDLKSAYVSSVNEISKTGPHRLQGHVLAAWDKHNLLVRSEDKLIHRIDLTDTNPFPQPGDLVTVAGKVESSFYNINLSHAFCRIDHPAATLIENPAERTDPDAILCNDRGERKIKPIFQGRTIRFRGIVRTAAGSDSGSTSRRFEIDCGRHVIPVILGDCPDLAVPPPVGSTIEASGTCVLDVENWRQEDPFPRIRGIFIVTRHAKDIVILSRPPWWTPLRMAIAIGISLVILIGILIWNQMLRHLVEKRTKELVDERFAHAKSELRIMERTNLAIELHDTLSQDLAAVACQISATVSQFESNPSEALKNLSTSETMLLSCRTELKRCLWDLRNDTLEDADLTQAILRTVSPLANSSDVSVRFNVPRKQLEDSTVHAIICIIRELVSNAILHGNATSVKIAGSIEANRILFSVSDNGCGFDVQHCPGPDQGHFGIAGICARIKRFNGHRSIHSTPGRGTHVRVVLQVPNQGKI